MKIRLLKPYQLFQAGDIVDFGGGVNQLLIERKRAEPYEEKRQGKQAKQLLKRDAGELADGLSDIH